MSDNGRTSRPRPSFDLGLHSTTEELARHYANLAAESYEVAVSLEARLDAVDEGVRVGLREVNRRLDDLSGSVPGTATTSGAHAAVQAIKMQQLEELLAARQRRWEIARAVIIAVLLAALGVLATVLLKTPR